MKCLILLLFFSVSFAQIEVTNSNTKNILINGIIEENEWVNSKEIKLSEDVVLLVKKDDSFIYFATVYKNEKHTGIDLYLGEINGPMVMLHASSTKSQRFYTQNEWGTSEWILTKDWTTNTVGVFIDDNGKRQLIIPEANEFQISKKILNTQQLFVRVHLKRPEKIFPPNTAENNIQNWINIKLHD